MRSTGRTGASPSAARSAPILAAASPAGRRRHRHLSTPRTTAVAGATGVHLGCGTAPPDDSTSRVRCRCKALRRAGINAPHHGAHLLRHSAATAMLRSGVSLTGIGSGSEAPLPEHDRALRQDRLRPAERNRPAVAGDDVMLSDHVERYLALRRALGYKLRDTARNLQAYARFAIDRGDTHVRAATAVEWSAQASSPHMRHVRLHDVVLLARFLYAEDATHEVPPSSLLPGPCGTPATLHLHPC